MTAPVIREGRGVRVGQEFEGGRQAAPWTAPSPRTTRPTRPCPGHPRARRAGGVRLVVRTEPRRLPRPARARVSWWAAAALLLAVLGAVMFAQLGPAGEAPQTTSVVQVGAGETVWDVAQRVAPQADQHDVVRQIFELNGMTGSAVAPGQQLRVPDGG